MDRKGISHGVDKKKQELWQEANVNVFSLLIQDSHVEYSNMVENMSNKEDIGSEKLKKEQNLDVHNRRTWLLVYGTVDEATHCSNPADNRLCL